MTVDPTAVLESQLVQADPPTPRPAPFTGWLVFALVLVALVWPLQLVARAIQAWLAVEQYGLAAIREGDPRWFALTAWAVASSGAMTLLAFATVPLFFLKRRVARLLLLAYFGGTFVLGVANHVINAVTAAPPAPPPSLWPVLGSVAVSALWIRYFASERVRRVFVR